MTPAGGPSPPARVLVVDDDPEIRYLLESILSAEGREIVLVDTAAGARAALAEGATDLILLDLLLPDADGREVLRSLRAEPTWSGVPVVVLTSRAGREVRTQCYELGADGFQEKPFDPEVLAADVASRLERSAALARLRNRDALTGLLDLGGLAEALGPEPGAAAVVVVELDGLAALAARQGWDAAERIVAEVARGLAAALEGMPLARIRGGEFAVVLPGAGRAEATSTAAAALEAVRRVPLKGTDGEIFRLTASAGCLAAEAAAPLTGLLEAARDLAERARQAGGNRVQGPGDEGAAAASAPPLALVAEDDPIAAKILSHRLAKEGFAVQVFDNGQDAYRGALSQTPSLVILDVKMPGMDGFEVLQRLRKTPSYAGIPIMMLTSMGSEADVVRGLELGADDYMLKPFSPNELLARIRRLARRGRDQG